MHLSTLLKATLALMVAAALAVAAAIALGGPTPPQPMASINDPFNAVDFSGMPPLLRYQAKDGAALAYRRYAPAQGMAQGSVVLVHGSSANSHSMHVLAKAYAAAGYDTFALDIRGHGASGENGAKGRIGYIGQLEDDLASFVATVAPAKPSRLVGFSSGGGFVLRFAGSPRQDLFQSYLLLSPYLGPDAPNYRPNAGGWVHVGVPRIVGLMLLNRLGIHGFNDLPVTNFALSDEAKARLTPAYSYALAANFGPQRDIVANIKAVHQPLAVLAGVSDEVFMTDKLEGFFRQQGQSWPVTLLPGVGHISLTLDGGAVRAAVHAVGAW